MLKLPNRTVRHALASALAYIAPKLVQLAVDKIEQRKADDRAGV